MRHLSPARFLAPLALIAAALAIYLIVKPVTETDSGSSGTTPAATSSTAAKKPKKPAASGAKKPSSGSGRTYTVKGGDTLSGIAQSTGVSVQRLLELNEGLDANTMQVGQKLKLGGG